MSESNESAAEQLARHFHETYERLAPSFGYETREASAKPWSEVPERNRKLMIAVCDELLAWRIVPLPLLGEDESGDPFEALGAKLNQLERYSYGDAMPEAELRSLWMETGMLFERCRLAVRGQES